MEFYQDFYKVLEGTLANGNRSKLTLTYRHQNNQRITRSTKIDALIK
jgi:hypothetical protein